MDIRGLTLTQPYASAVALRIKRVETRSWRTGYRELIAIHAAKGFPLYARDFAAIESALGRIPERLPLSQIVAVARLADCRPTEEVSHQISAIERRFGDYTPGRWAWILDDVEPLAEPVPYKGALGLWRMPDSMRFLLRRYMPSNSAIARHL